MTLVGAALSTKTGQTWAQAIAEFETLTGRPLPFRRCYDSGVPASFAASAMALDLGHRVSVWSFKPSLTTDINALNALALSIKASGHPCEVIIYHEPVDNMAGPDFVSLYRRSAVPFRLVGLPVGVCYTNYSAHLPYSNTRSALHNYWPGADVVDFVAIDEYPVGEITSSTDALPMDARTRRLCQFADAQGVPVGLAEYGVDYAWDAAKAERWLRSVTDWAAARAHAGRPLRWLSYFSSSVGGNYWLSNRTEFVDAYKDAAALLS